MKFRFGDKVRITAGFYESLTGKLTSHFLRDETESKAWAGTSKVASYSFDVPIKVDYFRIQLDENDDFAVIRASDVEKI